MMYQLWHNGGNRVANGGRLNENRDAASEWASNHDGDVIEGGIAHRCNGPEHALRPVWQYR